MQGTWPYEPVLIREEAQHSWERMDKTIIRPLGQRLAQHKLCEKGGAGVEHWEDKPGGTLQTKFSTLHGQIHTQMNPLIRQIKTAC